MSGLSVEGINGSAMERGVNGQVIVMADSYVPRMASESDRRWNSHMLMNRLAEETGGAAVTNNNDIAGAIRRDMEQGEHYYTLAYSPANRKWDGDYRSIKVEAAPRDLTLEYRRGYFAVAGSTLSAKQAADVLTQALQLGMPPSTMLPIRVRVLPSDSTSKTVRIDYGVLPRDVAFEDKDEQIKQATLDFLSIAWDENSRVAEKASDTLEAKLPKQTDIAKLAGGLPGHQELSLKPGKYTLALGAIDRTTQKFGAVWVPITVEKE